jgi:hypothetical protein
VTEILKFIHLQGQELLQFVLVIQQVQHSVDYLVVAGGGGSGVTGGGGGSRWL